MEIHIFCKGGTTFGPFFHRYEAQKTRHHIAKYGDSLGVRVPLSDMRVENATYRTNDDGTLTLVPFKG